MFRMQFRDDEDQRLFLAENAGSRGVPREALREGGRHQLVPSSPA